MRGDGVYILRRCMIHTYIYNIDECKYMIFVTGRQLCNVACSIT